MNCIIIILTLGLLMVALMKERELWEREDDQVEYETDKLYHYE